MNKVSFQVDAVDASWNTDTVYEGGNSGHRPGIKGGYFPVNRLTTRKTCAAKCCPP